MLDNTVNSHSAERLPLSHCPHIVPDVEFLCCSGVDIAVRRRSAAPVAASAVKNRAELFWLGGYRSEMDGTKAQAVDSFAERFGLACTRFDYSGHGRSGGDFYQGTISLWLQQSLAVFDHFHQAEKNTAAPPVIIGSSMGGWIALLMALELQRRGIKTGALVLLAPAPDFTELLIKPGMSAEQQRQLAENGFFISEEEGLAVPFSAALLEDGRKNRILQDKTLQKLACPVYIIQGMQDKTVPYKQALLLAEHLPLDTVSLTLIKNGDHRLSQPQNIDFLYKILETCINSI